MIKCELCKLSKSWKAKIIIFIGVVLSMFHTWDSIFYTGASERKMNQYHPAFASFLNGISANGSYRTYFLWIMPMFLIMAYSGMYVSEKRKNIDVILYTRMNKKEFFFSKIKTAAIFAVILNLIPNIISIVMTSIFLHGKKGFMDAESWSRSDYGDFPYWCVHNPYLTYVIYLLSNLIVMALLSIVCQSIVFVVEDAKLATLIAIAIWLGIYMGNDLFYIGYILQPFIDENTLETIVMSWATYIPMVILWVTAAYFKVVKKSDKL